jgi:hypothetical protein
MSVIHLNQIRGQLHKLFDGKIDLTDVVTLQTPPEQIENVFLSRALAAYAVRFLSHANEETAATAVTDGGKDNGIDAIHYDELERRLYIVQSKWINTGIGEPENGDVKKYVSGVRDLFNLLFDRFNAKINGKKALILAALNDTSTRYDVVLIYTGMSRLAEPSARDLEDLAEEMNDAAEVLSVTPLNQADIYSSLTAGLVGEPINIDIGLKSWGRVDAPHTAYYGQVDGGQIATWWDKHRNRLFTKNLRGVLGDTDVNDEIRGTIDKNPELFWYFNNGVTLVCKKIAKTMVGGADSSFGTFHCEDISVVNGAQTVGTIGKFAGTAAEAVSKLQIPLRMISLEQGDTQFGEKVTKTNNRQNRIENRDFVSLDPEQTRIRTELAVEGIEYHLVRTDAVISTPTSFDLVESTTSLACASGDIALVVQLKRELGKLWENIEKAPYKQLFNPQVNGLYVWRCVQLQRQIDRALDQLTSDFTAKAGREYGVAVHGNRVLAALVFDFLKAKRFSDPAFDIKPVLDQMELEKHVWEQYQLLFGFVEKEYSNAIIPTLFKNLTKCKNLAGLCRSAGN